MYRKRRKRKSLRIGILLTGIVLLICLFAFVLFNINNLSSVQNLTINNATENSLTLSWNRVAFANKYTIYRAEEQSNNLTTKYKKCANVSSTTYKDDNLTQATKYKYRIFACFALGDNVISQSSSAKIVGVTKPKQVKNFVVSDITSSSVKLSWENNPNITEYILERAKEQPSGKYEEDDSQKIKTTNNKNYYIDNDLSSGVGYKYRIKSVIKTKPNTSGVESEFLVSDPTELSVMTKIAPPKTFKTTKTTLSKIYLEWTLTNNVDKYELYRDKKLLKTFYNGSSYVDTDLETGHTYNYSIRAIRMYKNKEYKSPFKYLKVSTNVRVPTVAGGLNGTWVQIDLSKQEMKMFVDSKLYVETPVVTGNVGGHETAKGHHQVISMGSPSRLKGDSWDIMVDYWMGFTYDGQGIHDSTWRSEYGGDIYLWNGSHGCVNTPYDAVKKMYSMAYIGMPVIIY